MPSVVFSVPFVRGKSRPRFNGKRAYTPRATVEAERAILAAFLEAAQGQAAAAGIPVAVVCFTCRNVTSKLRKKDGDKQPDTQKPDADNVLKLVMDALNGAAYADDSQVVKAGVMKLPRRRGQESITVVLVMWGDEYGL